MTLAQIAALLTVIVLDVSRYQALLDGQILKANGVPAVILKSSGGLSRDSRFDQHYAELQKNEVHTPAYHWLDPIYPAERQIDFFLSLMAGRNVPFYVLDIEQWWNNWGLWGQAVMKQITWSLVPRIAPLRIATHAHIAAQYLVAKTNKPVLLYTSRGFVRSYAPQMAEWLDDFDHWGANYVIYSSKKITTTWQGLRSSYLPAGNVPLLADGVKPERVRGWQYTADLISLPGVYSDPLKNRLSPLDISVFDPTWLSQVLGTAPVSTLPVPEKKPVRLYEVSRWVTLGLNLRTAPNTGARVLKTLKSGTRVEGTGSTSSQWIEVTYAGLTGWLHSAYVNKL